MEEKKLIFQTSSTAVDCCNGEENSNFESLASKNSNLNSYINRPNNLIEYNTIIGPIDPINQSISQSPLVHLN